MQGWPGGLWLEPSFPNSLSSFQLIVERRHQRECRVCKHHLTLVCLESSRTACATGGEQIVHHPAALWGVGGMAAAINQQHCPAPSYPPCLHLSPCAGSWDHRVLWVGKDLKTHPAPRPAVSGDTFHEAAPRPAQPGLARFGVFRPFLGCRPWWHTWTPGQARSGWLSFCWKAHKHQMLHAGETKSAFL